MREAGDVVVTDVPAILAQMRGCRNRAAIASSPPAPGPMPPCARPIAAMSILTPRRRGSAQWRSCSVIWSADDRRRERTQRFAAIGAASRPVTLGLRTTVQRTGR
jgi:hypothetical protein